MKSFWHEYWIYQIVPGNETVFSKFPLDQKLGPMVDPWAKAASMFVSEGQQMCEDIK